MEDVNWQQVGLRLKAERKKSGLTIERLSELVGVSPSFIGLIERAVSGVSVENLYKLAQIYNCSLDYLVTGNHNTIHATNDTKFAHLTTALYDYNNDEIHTIIELAKLLRGKVEIRTVEQP